MQQVAPLVKSKIVFLQILLFTSMRICIHIHINICIHTHTYIYVKNLMNISHKFCFGGGLSRSCGILMHCCNKSVAFNVFLAQGKAELLK